nr:hypothetical protein [uncultured Devosia sp.]
MIGQFLYEARPPIGSIIVEMAWQEGEPTGSVTVPAEVRQSAIDNHVPVLEPGESLSLALAVGYAVTIAMLTDQELCLTGDRTAWREEWGWLNRSN